MAKSVQCLTAHRVLPLHSCGKMQNVFKIPSRNVLGRRWMGQNGLSIPVPEANAFPFLQRSLPAVRDSRKGELVIITSSRLGLFSLPNFGSSKL